MQIIHLQKPPIKGLAKKHKAQEDLTKFTKKEKEKEDITNKNSYGQCQA